MLTIDIYTVLYSNSGFVFVLLGEESAGILQIVPDPSAYRLSYVRVLTLSVPLYLATTHHYFPLTSSLFDLFI